MVVPLAQTVPLDINPRERIDQAMAIHGGGIMVDPIIGPALGGWLTESFYWRHVFLISLPLGIIALAGIMAFLPQSPTKARRFDVFGFAMLALAVRSLQLLLDRGEAASWFGSVETWLHLSLAISGLWIFLIHCSTSRWGSSSASSSE